MKYIFNCLSVFILCSCLGRYSKPPVDEISRAVFCRIPEKVSGIRVSAGILSVSAGRMLYLQKNGKKIRLAMRDPVSSIACLASTAAVVEEGRVLSLFDLKGERADLLKRIELPEPVPVPVMAVRDGFLLCGNRGTVFHISRKTLSLRSVWKAAKGIASDPVRFSGGVCVVSFSGECAVLDFSGRRVLRKFRLPAVPDSSPVFLKKGLCFAARDLRLILTGKKREKIAVSRRVRSWANRLTILDGRPLYRTWHGDLVSVDPVALRDYWRFRSRVRLTLPLVSGYRLFCGSRDGVLRILYRPNGGLTGSIRLGSGPVLRPVLYRGRVLAACGRTVYRIMASRAPGISGE